MSVTLCLESSAATASGSPVMGSYCAGEHRWATPTAHHRPPNCSREIISSRKVCWTMATKWRRSHRALVRWGEYNLGMFLYTVYQTGPLAHCWRTETISTHCYSPHSTPTLWRVWWVVKCHVMWRVWCVVGSVVSC